MSGTHMDTPVSRIRPAATSDEDTSLSAAAEVIQRALAGSDVPGLVIGLTDRARLRRIVVHGHEDLRSKKPMTADSLLAIGSTSKSFTAIALLQLASEGRIELQAPVTVYLPHLAINSPFAPISLHHLITHSSGLPNYLVHTASSRYAIDALKDTAPGYEPGAHWCYSNTGYQLLGYVLEAVEGLTYPAIIRRRILDPLGMTSTSCVIDDAQRGRVATSYARWPYDGTYREAPWFEYSAGDGSLVSTVPDMCAYARLILNGGATPTGRLLSEANFATLTTPVLQDYAYGLMVKPVDGHNVVGHGGNIAGYHCVFDIYTDDGFGLVILSNSAIDVPVQRWITDTVFAAFRGEQLPPPLDRWDAWKRDARDFAGVYQASRGNSAPVRSLEFIANGKDLLVVENDGLQPVQRMGKDVFRLVHDDSHHLPFIFGRAKTDSDEPVIGVSRGAQWFAKVNSCEQTAVDSSQSYAAYVGHFANVGPEGPAARVFVREGRLWVLMSLNEFGAPLLLEPLGEGLFRMGEETYSPERVRFDTIMDGVATRMMFSGVPLYRRETP
jgi:CubicO group peptidase (beta-lactamase class C family)